MIEAIKCVCGIWFYPVKQRGRRILHCSRECRFKYLRWLVITEQTKPVITKKIVEEGEIF